MDRIANATSPGLVSTLAGVLGLALVVVAVAGSPAPWWAAVAVAALELLGVSWIVGRNARAAVAETVEPARPRVVKAAA